MYGAIARNYLFSKGDMFAVIRRQQEELKNEINGIPEQRLLNTSVEDLVNYFEQKYKFEVPELNAEQAVADQHEGDVAVSGFMYGLRDGEVHLVKGTVVTLEVPFNGDFQMFNIRPNTYTSAPPVADVSQNVITLRQQGTDLSAEQVQSQFEQKISEIEKYLTWQKNDVADFNRSLRTVSHEAIEARRNKLLANQNLVAGLKFKLKTRTDAPTTYAAPIHKKRIEPRLPQASTTTFKPEPVLPEEDYANILKIMHDMTLVMERSPSAFSSMGEEDIRHHFLVQLNGQYEGKATGETFNSNGKTDILIRHEGRNIFIAECKFWKGEKVYLDTISQILSYLSWRDTKTALVIFNQNKDFSGVLSKIEEVTSQHPLFKSGPKVEGETRFRYIFGQHDDPNREVVITVMAFNIPKIETKTEA